MTSPDPTRYDALWMAQWQRLREWIETSTLLDHADGPSVLPGWTVRDLIAHLGRGFMTASMAKPAHDDEPRSLLGYMSGYAPVAAEIEVATRAFAVELGDDLLGSLDRIATTAFADLAKLETEVVRGPRGPIRRDDLVVTRLVELVAHGDDLMRSVPSAGGKPLLDEAVAVVAHGLASGYAVLTGRPPTSTGLAWVRAASGRTTSEDPHLPLF